MNNSPRQAAFLEDLSHAMRRDQFRLRRWFHRIQRAQQSGQDQTAQIAKWQKQLERSIELCNSRRTLLPDPALDPQLPIAERADEIRQAISDHQVVVVSGETGSGKSTQLPLVCLQLGLGIAGYVGHTQPRRIAARSVAARIAEQMQTNLGDLVGYKIRFSDQTKPQTLIKVMTDGILLAETQADRFLDQYEVVIIDEAHERSLNIDFLLGLLRRLIPRRPDLKVIITSATIDTQKFAEHFAWDEVASVPIIDVEGRNFPVDIEYRPPGLDPDGQPIDQDVESAVVNAVLELAARDRGDLLVFLPTEQDIRSLSNKLRALSFPGDGAGAHTEVLPLYGRLSTEQQNQVFRPGAPRRVVLATNVAESSITVPRIRYVIDTGTARISRYAPRSKVQRLPIEAVSQASADQRAGRCGRLGPGICVRIFSEDDYLGRAKFTTPEIRRTNLASVILQTEALRLGKIDEFPFIDPPRADAVRDGYRTLHEIGAIDEAQQLTPMGKKLSRLPVDPRIGRMLYAGAEHGCLAEVLIIAAALEVQDPRVRPPDKQAAADQQHAKFKHEESDFVGLLLLWEFVHQQRERLSRNRFRKTCSQNFLSFTLIRQWMDIYRQLKGILLEHKLPIASDRENYAAIHQSLLTGLFSGVAQRTGDREFTGAGGIKFSVWPGSGLAKSKAAWILVAEIVETARRFGRIVARIEPSWIEPLAEHLVKRTYSEPHWSKKRQSATAFERVTLYGLPIVSRRAVRYGDIDPQHSREILIEDGLTADQMRVAPPFLVENRKTLARLETLAAKSRERQLLIDAHRIRQFYANRLPSEVVDVASLNAQLKKDPTLDQRLRFQLSELLPESVTEVSESDYPPSMEIGDLALPIQYKFQPGAEDDGVSVRVPVEGVAQIHENHLAWSIPGLLESRITALIRSLPKIVRRQLIPAPDTARHIAERIRFGQGSFWQVVAEELSQLAGQPIAPEMFDHTKLDDFLNLNVQVCEEDGQVIAQSRDLETLKSQLPQCQLGSELPIADDSSWHQDDLIDWTWKDLPERILVNRGFTGVPLFPAIVDAGQTVKLRLLDEADLADMVTRRGLSTLYWILHRKLLRTQVNWLPELERLELMAMPLVATGGTMESAEPFKTQLAKLIARLAFVEDRPLVRSRIEFDQRCHRAVEAIGIATQGITPWLARFLDSYQQCRVELEKLATRQGQARADIESQFSHLFRRDFMLETPWRWLQHYPRYLQAVLTRLDRLRSGKTDQDSAGTNQIDDFWQRYLSERCKQPSDIPFNKRLENFAWMIQEFRVSLFAQKLGTSETVSAKRLEKLWRDLYCEV